MTIDEILKILEMGSRCKISFISYEGLKVKFSDVVSMPKEDPLSFVGTHQSYPFSVDPNTVTMSKNAYDDLKAAVINSRQSSKNGPITVSNNGPAAVLQTHTELKAEDILKPPAHLDKLSEEEILYAATPYFDELQSKKQIHEEQLKSGAK